MKTSNKGIELLKKFEGLRLETYLCSAGKLTIGYGQTGSILGKPIVQNMHITKEQAEQALVNSLVQYEQGVLKTLTRQPKQHEFDAMVCLAYNIGVANFSRSSVVKYFNLNRTNATAQAFLMWNKIKNPKTGQYEVLPGLARRREAERSLFLQG